jgi:hypothetical protein
MKNKILQLIVICSFIGFNISSTVYGSSGYALIYDADDNVIQQIESNTDRATLGRLIAAVFSLCDIQFSYYDVESTYQGVVVENVERVEALSSSKCAVSRYILNDKHKIVIKNVSFNLNRFQFEVIMHDGNNWDNGFKVTMTFSHSVQTIIGLQVTIKDSGYTASEGYPPYDVPAHMAFFSFL